jgi:predicted DNA-binding protein (UPF0251 family)
LTRGAIPKDDELRAMSETAIDDLSRGLAAEAARTGDDGPVEELSNALLRINDGWRAGAHSETSDTRRRRRIAGTETLVAECPEWAPAPPNAVDIDRLLGRAHEADLTERQYTVWILCDEQGYSQAAAAQVMGIKQPAVSRLLNRAREALMDYIDKHDPYYRVFVREIHRASYRRPGYRPPLPAALDGARQLLERDRRISTHIMPDCLSRVEPWLNGDPIVLDSQSREPIHYSLSFREVISRGRKIKKFEASCNKVPEN